MQGLCIVIWLLSLVVFVVFFFKKRKARKAAGTDYKQNELYLDVSKKKRIVGIVCLLALVGSFVFAPTKTATPEEIQAQQEQAAAKKAAEQAKKEEAAAKKAEEQAKKEEAAAKQAEEKAKKDAEDKAKQEAEAHNPEIICKKALGSYYKSCEYDNTSRGLVVNVFMSPNTSDYDRLDRLNNDKKTLERYSMEMEMNKVVGALFASPLDIYSITAHIQGNARDAEGNLLKDSDWVRCTVYSSTGKNKSWDNADATFSKYDQVWTINGLD